MRNDSTSFLGSKVRELRKANKMTQEELATVCGISERTISEIENDKGNPGYDIMAALIRFFRVSADVFFRSGTDGEDEHIKELLANYQACTKEQQEIGFDMIKLMATKNLTKKKGKGGMRKDA